MVKTDNKKTEKLAQSIKAAIEDLQIRQENEDKRLKGQKRSFSMAVNDLLSASAVKRVRKVAN